MIIPNIWKNKIDVPNHQPVNLYGYKPSTMSLVGGIPTPLKHMKVSWDDYPQYMEKNHWCSKPPTSHSIRMATTHPLWVWLVVYLPLWNIWKSVGMIIPNIWKNKIDVPNHQPVIQSVWLQAIHYESGWWYTYPSETYESQLGWLSPIYGKIKLMFQTTNQSFNLYGYKPSTMSLVGGIPTPLKHMKVSWDDYPQYMEK